jgi:predicted MFS family arabinose efflux permease
MTNDNSARPQSALRLSHILALVPLWNSGYRGARILNTLFALSLGAQPFEIGLLLATYGLLPLILGVPASGGGRQRMMDLVRVPDLRRVYITSAVVMTGVDLFHLYIPLYAHGLGLSASAIGFVVGAFAVAGFITRALVPLLARKLGEERKLTLSRPVR